MKSFYRYLEEQELISENPFYKMRFQFRVEKNLPKIIPSFDLEAIYDYLYEEKANAGTPFRIEKSSRNLLITELLISTGLRISELCHITIEDIDVPNRTIKILGKGKKERVTYLGNDHTYTLLLNYIAQYRTNNSGFLFLGHNRHDNLSEQSVRLLFKSVCQKIDLNKSVTPHMFRHTFATMLLDNNVDTRHIQQILGHSSITVTQIYTHVSQTKQQEILTHHNPINSLSIKRWVFK